MGAIHSISVVPERTTSRGIPQFSKLSYRKFQFHLISLPECPDFWVEWIEPNVYGKIPKKYFSASPLISWTQLNYSSLGFRSAPSWGKASMGHFFTFSSGSFKKLFWNWNNFLFLPLPCVSSNCFGLSLSAKHFFRFAERQKGLWFLWDISLISLNFGYILSASEDFTRKNSQWIVPRDEYNI